MVAREIVRRYLSVYGPATPQDFGRWWGAGTRLATKTFKELEGELEAVDIEGHEAFALHSSLEPMEKLSAAGVVRLLPMFGVIVTEAERLNDFLDTRVSVEFDAVSGFSKKDLTPDA